MLIGITGGIGSGKSIIAQGLRERGFTVYDCDTEAKRIIAQNRQVQAQIIALLGEEAFSEGQYNTTYVAKRVFEDPALLQQLNAIVHPAVVEHVKDERLKVKGVLFVESAILFEAGLDELCEKIIVVEAPEEIRLERVIKRDYQGQATPENINKVRARIHAQQKSPAYPEASQGKIYTVINDGTSVLSSIIDLVCNIAAH